MDESAMALTGGTFQYVPRIALYLVGTLVAVVPAWGQPGGTTPVRLFDGQSLKGWQVAEELFFRDHGLVRVVDGKIVLDAGDPATGIVWQGEMPRENYELVVEAARLEGSDFFCGITFPVGDSYCTFIAGGWGGGVVGLSNIDGLSAVENETTGYHDFRPNTFYTLRVRVTPDAVKVHIDQKETVSVSRAGKKFSIWFEQEPMRPLGIASWQTKAAIRRVELVRLPAR